MALNAREKTEKLLKDNGWELDPEKRVVKDSRYDYEQKKTIQTWTQDPNSFVRIKDDGTGFYYLTLHHQQRSGYGYSSRGTTNTLSSAYFLHGPDDEGNRADIGSLAQPTNWRSAGHVFNALAQDDKDLSLRDKLNLITKDPTKAHWLIVEERYNSDQADKKRLEQDEADRKARKQPLPVTIPVGEYYWDRGTFKELAHAAKWAADKIESADGKSDLPALVAELHKAVAAVTEALNDEASLRVGELLAEHVNELVGA